MNATAACCSSSVSDPAPSAGWFPRPASALAQADALIGYKPYTDRVPERAGLERFPTDNRVEILRARHALELAQAGRKVAVVSGGDAGVFGMAAAVFEAMEAGDPAWRDARHPHHCPASAP